MTSRRADSGTPGFRRARAATPSTSADSDRRESWVPDRWEDLGDAPATRNDGVPMYRRRSGRRARDSAQPPHRHGWGVTVLRELTVVLVWALLIAFVAKHVLIRGFMIPSNAMEPTLMTGDRVFVNVLQTTLRPAERGEIIVFKDTQGWLPPTDEPRHLGDWLRDGLAFLGVAVDDSDNHVVKRVIGIGGDRVTCCDAEGRIVVNDVALDEEGAYLAEGEAASDIEFDVIVPDEHYFVLGDRRAASGDSRFYLPENRAFVSQEDVVGAAFVITRPRDRMGPLRDWSSVYDRIPQNQSSSRWGGWL